MSEKEAEEFATGLKETNKSFESQWLTKLITGLDETVGKETRDKIVKGNAGLRATVDEQGVIEWTREMIQRLDSMLNEKDRTKVMVGCACRFPEQRLQPLNQKYKETKDITTVQNMLREMFISDLKNVLKLDDELVKKIIGLGWGLAGVKKDDHTIIATKMPFELTEYLRAKDPQEKRYRYCHCPRIRRAIKSAENRISTTYCYCGAGFYKYIWEKILEQPVEVRVLETALGGSDVCRIAIHLPSRATQKSKQ